MSKQIISEEFKHMQKFAGILNKNKDNTLESKIQQWANNNAGGYGPEETDPNYSEFKSKIDSLLFNTLEDLNPDYYGDDISMSPDDILEEFIDEAINIISEYAMGDYGDSTSFSPDDIKNEFYEFVK